MSSFLRTIRKIVCRNRFVSHTLSTNLKESTVKIIVGNGHFNSLATLLQFVVIVGAMEPKKRAQKVSMSLESKAQHYLNALKVRWMQLHEIPGMFAYQLQEARQGRRLPGKHGFYGELNAERSLKRRVPQAIESLNPTFKPKQFNFNKVDALEVMMTIDKEKDNSEVQMIINKSPLTKYHTLICPDVKSNLVQRATLSALSFCINFMRSINDAAVRLGYNSPGALASVNHLHFHMVHIPRDLYIDNVELQPLAGDYVYRLKPESPTEAICYVITARDTEREVREKVGNLHRLTEWLCDNQLPHNLFITHNHKSDDLRVFVFVRAKYCVTKDITAFNVGFCEMVGFLPLSDADKLQNMTEQMVIERIQDITGNAYESAYEQVKLIINGNIDAAWFHSLVI
ncbi:GDP-D-glucose phosphorylase 1 [Drosophila montana]|uniref:GDP-D-glucose phosphorylase 1 n=1 Tax=Drosophila montana TaxID=40370 RepID=UPI00313BCA5A